MKKTIATVITILTLSTSYAQESNKDFSSARVNKYSGLYVFFDCKPAYDYEVIAVAKMVTVCDGFQECAEKYADKIRKEYPSADGFLISKLNPMGKDRFEIIKFKK
ncbi:MAG: hypothetical protein KA242_06525 [Chitinophagales bacterium]|jgi:hypothetical protein|nr:hypothetical protein [Chitinophagales bacterium]